MGIKIMVLAVLLLLVVAEPPVVLVSDQPHHPLFTSNELLQYMAKQTEAQLVSLTSFVSDDLNELRTILRESGVPKQRISSFLTSAQKIKDLKIKLLKMPILTHTNATLEELKGLLRDANKDIIITLAPTRTPRLLQTPNRTNTTVDSKIFDDITPYSLSGLWVGLFLLVVLLIGINCLLSLKTNDRFARQNLWVGRES